MSTSSMERSIIQGMIAVLVLSCSDAGEPSTMSNTRQPSTSDAGVEPTPKPDTIYTPVYQDPLFTEVFVDVDEWRTEPVRHRYVHGGFKDTDARFSIYFPPEDRYQGRFFQYILPVSGNEHAVSRPEYPDPSYAIGFAVDNGAYLVETNGGKADFLPASDPSITLWRTSAAVAEHSRLLANEFYPELGPHRPFGYAWGGSGGAFKTIACIENTQGVWDGVVPFIHATPVALPNDFTVQAHAMRLLRDKLPAIVDAIDPGGSGDMYAELDAEEAAALREVTKMGFPPDAWFNYRSIALGYTGVLASLLDSVILLDSSYFQDFWSMPGYLGHDQADAIAPYRIKHTTSVVKAVMPAELNALGQPLSLSASQPANANIPAAFELKDLPDGDLQGASIKVKSGAAEGTTVYIAGVFEGLVSIGYGQGFQALANLQAGDEVELDNSVYLAMQTYHRHQVPSSEYAVYDQYRDESGKPLYPQRSVNVTSLFNQSGMMSGKFEGKMIVVESLMDEIAFAWQADWYRTRVKAALGDGLDDNYRLWFVERAMHMPPKDMASGLKPALTTRAINFGPVLQQALRALAAWAEKDEPPPASTSYEVVDGQVQVPASAAERKGVQPVVTVTVEGSQRADVEVGEPVTFEAAIEAPPGAGTIVEAEWDFEGAGDFPTREELDGGARNRLELRTTYTFSQPGTYFPTLRARSHANGDADSPYARIENLGRVRVVVR